MIKKLCFWATVTLFAWLGLTGCTSGAKVAVSPAEKIKFDNQPRIGVIVSEPEELAPLLAECTGARTIAFSGREFIIGNISGAPVVILCCGKSMVNASAAAQQTIDFFNLKAIVMSGTAGAVNPSLLPGDVAIPTRWAQHGETLLARQKGENQWDISTSTPNFFNDGAHFGMIFPRAVSIRRQDKTEYRYWFECSPELLNIARTVPARLRLTPMRNLTAADRPPVATTGGNGVSSTATVDNPDFRDWLWQTFKAETTDSETAAVAQVASLNNIPFIACRAVTETAGSERNPNEQEIREIARRNAAAFVISLLNNYARAKFNPETRG